MNKKLIGVFCFLFFCNLIAFLFIFNKEDNLRVTFFNIGQGDSIFIETNQGHQILIDGGPDNSVLNSLEKRMNPFDKNIDMIILTHADKDHLAGIVSVLKIYEVDVFVWTGEESDSALFQELKELLTNKKVVTVDAHDKITIGEVFFEIYNPMIPNLSDLNDTSIVFKLIHGSSQFLLTGDVSSNLEDDLVKEFDLKSDVLKIAHHGSKNSTTNEFIKEVSPNCAVISVGKNSYGHPSERVLNLLEEEKIKIFRTDIDGEVTFFSNGEEIFVEY